MIRYCHLSCGSTKADFTTSSLGFYGIRGKTLAVLGIVNFKPLELANSRSIKPVLVDPAGPFVAKIRTRHAHTMEFCLKHGRDHRQAPELTNQLEDNVDT